MILLSIVKPVLILCMILLYITLGWRFLKAKSKLQISGLKNGVGSLAKRKRQLALFGVLFFLIYFISRLLTELWSPGMLMVFNYEEAARGQNPNATRFNESNILSEHILEKVIQRGDLKMSPEQLSDCLTISTPLDSEKLDVSQESDLKISTEYWIHCSKRISLHHTEPKTVLNFLADVYREDFTLNYAENDSVLNLSFDDLEGMEYLDVKDYLQMQAIKVRDYLPSQSNESSSFRAEEDQETFSSLYEKIQNYIDIELERYGAYILENGLSTKKDTYQSRMQYANHLLETTRKKDMAAHDVRIEAIDIYDAFMTRFVLIPTYDVEQEFYMSRTKVGVDYFADEATEFLASATELVEEMEHNSYASAQVAKSQAPANAYEEADRQIDNLKTELLNLAEQSRTLCDTYVAEKRDGYIQVCFSSPSASGIAVNTFLLTLLFVIALGGNMILEPFCQDYSKACAAGRKTWGLRRKNGKTEKGDAS
ncbi:hypothetical protein [Schaedlerella sp.]|uniref:hypothetical protein n=1 Tax=Schaedlerella sp. TaxID=2676057 RepID=UPI00374775F6